MKRSSRIPFLVLWVSDIEIGKQLGLIEVKMTAKVVVHDIRGTREIERCVKVAVMTLADPIEF